jgi:hypothetical protein
VKSRNLKFIQWSNLDFRQRAGVKAKARAVYEQVCHTGRLEHEYDGSGKEIQLNQPSES